MFSDIIARNNFLSPDDSNRATSDDFTWRDLLLSGSRQPPNEEIASPREKTTGNIARARWKTPGGATGEDRGRPGGGKSACISANDSNSETRGRSGNVRETKRSGLEEGRARQPVGDKERERDVGVPLPVAPGGRRRGRGQKTRRGARVAG